MILYWKNKEISPGTLLRIEERDNDVRRADGSRAEVTWRILDIRSRGQGEDYLEPAAGTCHSVEKLMKRRKLQRKMEAGELVQIPASSDYLVVREYHDDRFAGFRCYSVDMLGLLRDVEVIE